MNNPVLDAISSVVTRMKEEFGVEPRVGQEWEFQLLNSSGEALDKYEMDEQLKALLEGLPFEKVYKERAYGMHEVTTQALPPEEAALAMRQIQEKIAGYAKDNDYHLSACPMMAGKNGEGITGSAGFHNNISLQSVTGEKSILAINEDLSEIDTLTAHLADKTNRMAQETSAWSYHSQEDFARIQGGDGVAKAFKVGSGKRGGPGIEIRSNDVIPDVLETLGGAEGYTARLENRYASARIDPEVATFRDVVAQYDALKTRAEILDGKLRVDSLENLGAVPLSMEEVQALHLQEGSILHKYVGDLYDAETLKLIDEKGRNPWILQHESDRFQYKAPAVSGVKAASNIDLQDAIAQPLDSNSIPVSTTEVLSPSSAISIADVAPNPAISSDGNLLTLNAKSEFLETVIENNSPASATNANVANGATNVVDNSQEAVKNVIEDTKEVSKGSSALVATENPVGKAKSAHLATVGNVAQMAGGTLLVADGLRRLHEDGKQEALGDTPLTFVQQIKHKGLATGEILVGAGLAANGASEQFTGKSAMAWVREAAQAGLQVASKTR